MDNLKITKDSPLPIITLEMVAIRARPGVSTRPIRGSPSRPSGAVRPGVRTIRRLPAGTSVQPGQPTRPPTPVGVLVVSINIERSSSGLPSARFISRLDSRFGLRLGLSFWTPVLNSR